MNETQLTSILPKEESLRAQLTELNNRSRWYSSELWQVPFAYLGISCFVIGQVADKAEGHLSLAFAVSAIFGVFVVIHMHKLRSSEQRAIKNLQETEKALNLSVTAHTGEGLKIFQIAVIFAVLVYAAAAICLALVTLADK